VSESTEQKLDALARRLERVEDELAIQRLIVRYGLAVDSGDAEATAALFTEDCIYEVRAVGTGLDDRAGPLIMRGRQGVADMVKGENHQSLLPNAAHTIGPAVVSVEGDRAHATGYSRVYHRREGNYVLFRLGANHWELVKQDGRWLIHRRVSQAVGESDVQDVMRLGLEGP
jgi:ketosteroid isomerase-like protein